MSSFRTLERQEEAINPSKELPHYPDLAAISEPHLESFNSIFQFGSGIGLLDQAVLSIPKLTVFDGIRGGEVPLEDRNKLTSIPNSCSVDFKPHGGSSSH
jgi:DNA-directed RNA polymerase I subunit RPA2